MGPHPVWAMNIFVGVGLQTSYEWFNKLELRQNGFHSAEDILMCFSLNENSSILIQISQKFVSEGEIDNRYHRLS